MLSIAEWHEIFKYIYGVFFTIIIGTGIIGQIATRIKSKQKIKQSQQIIRVGLKVLKNVY